MPNVNEARLICCSHVEQATRAKGDVDASKMLIGFSNGKAVKPYRLVACDACAKQLVAALAPVGFTIKGGLVGKDTDSGKLLDEMLTGMCPHTY
jgi:hypothetical protein